MVNGAVLLTFFLSAHPVVWAFPQPFEYISALNNFAFGFLHPETIVKLGISPALSKDVVGRVDITTTFVGAELNTEYLYGLFLGDNEANTTQLIGDIVSQTTQTLVVEPPMVFASLITLLQYPTIGNYTLPMQFDLILRFDDSMKIISWDVILRRWAQAMEYIFPKLAPQIAIELNQTYEPGKSNDTELVVQRAAIDVCNIAMQYCTGNNTQYQSFDSCTQFLTKEVPFGEGWAGGLNTGWCRYVHKNMVKYRPSVHCPHIGPSGGDMCIDRDYVSVVNAFPFNSTLVAPNASFVASDEKGLSALAVNELSKLNLERISATTVAFYPVPAVLYFLLLYVCGKGVEALLGRFSMVYTQLSFENKRNTVTYFLNTFWTTVTLALQLVASPMLAQEYSYDRVNILRLAGLIISGLYIYELIYRPRMRIPLLIHHFCTLFAIVLIISALQVTEHPALSVLGLLWLFHATTEQSLFIALIFYRLKYSKLLVQRTLYFSAVQSLLFKFAFSIYLFVWWGLKLEQNHSRAIDIAFSVMFVIILSALMVTQVYGSWAAWSIAVAMDKRDRPQETQPSKDSGALKDINIFRSRFIGKHVRKETESSKPIFNMYSRDPSALDLTYSRKPSSSDLTHSRSFSVSDLSVDTPPRLATPHPPRLAPLRRSDFTEEIQLTFPPPRNAPGVEGQGYDIANR